MCENTRIIIIKIQLLCVIHAIKYSISKTGHRFIFIIIAIHLNGKLFKPDLFQYTQALFYDSQPLYARDILLWFITTITALRNAYTAFITRV